MVLGFFEEELVASLGVVVHLVLSDSRQRLGHERSRGTWAIVELVHVVVVHVQEETYTTSWNLAHPNGT